MKWIVLFFVWGASAQAQYEKIVIPDSRCGDGSPYHVFVKTQKSHELLITFMGGGACWDKTSCFGPSPKTTLFAVPEKPVSGALLSSDESVNPFARSDEIFFPYCNGDVFGGRHSTSYGGRPIFHEGAENVDKSLSYLVSIGRLIPDYYNEVVVFGFSAGALGALLNLPRLHREFSAPKYFFVDSPGLHFGKKFWAKFQPGLIQDYSQAMAEIGIRLSPQNGNVGGQVNGVCDRFQDVKIAILQGSRDLIMSSIFGDISPFEHEALIFSAQGLVASVERAPENCAAWVPRTFVHTFLTENFLSAASFNLELSAMNFVREVHSGKLQSHY